MISFFPLTSFADMSQFSKTNRPMTFEERMETRMDNMYNRLNLAIEDIATRMDERDGRRNRSHPRRRHRQDDDESHGDNSEVDRREIRREDDDIRSIKMQIPPFR